MSSEPVADDADLPVAGTVVILRDRPYAPEVLLLRRPDRGSFPGAWVFPGGMVDPSDRRDEAGEQEDACRAAVRETAEEVGLNLDRLVPLSCWMPPVGIPKRVRTWYVLAADPGDQRAAAPDEGGEARWTTPADALAAHDAGEIVLVPPTWRTLHALGDVRDSEAALARVRGSEPELFRTRVARTDEGTLFFWDGDELAGASAGSRDRLWAASTPWRYERS